MSTNNVPPSGPRGSTGLTRRRRYLSGEERALALVVVGPRASNESGYGTSERDG